MKKIIVRKINEQYDIYLNRWDKIEDVFSSENDYIADRLNEIDYKTAYETSFECNKFLSEKYNELAKRIDKVNELLEKYNDKENNYYVPIDKCINILRGKIDVED